MPCDALRVSLCLPPPTASLLPTGEMSDAGETLLAMYESIREAHPGAGAALDALFGLRQAEEVRLVMPAR